MPYTLSDKDKKELLLFAAAYFPTTTMIDVEKGEAEEVEEIKARIQKEFGESFFLQWSSLAELRAKISKFHYEYANIDQLKTDPIELQNKLETIIELRHQQSKIFPLLSDSRGPLQTLVDLAASAIIKQWDLYKSFIGSLPFELLEKLAGITPSHQETLIAIEQRWLNRVEFIFDYAELEMADALNNCLIEQNILQLDEETKKTDEDEENEDNFYLIKEGMIRHLVVVISCGHYDLFKKLYQLFKDEVKVEKLISTYNYSSERAKQCYQNLHVLLLSYAVLYGQIALVDYLLDQNRYLSWSHYQYDFPQGTASEEIYIMEEVELCDLDNRQFLSNEFYRNPLNLAVFCSSIPMVQRLLKAGAKLESLSHYVLFEFVGTGDFKFLQFLIDKEFQVNVELFSLLGIASRSGNIDFVNSLLARGAEINPSLTKSELWSSEETPEKSIGNHTILNSATYGPHYLNLLSHFLLPLEAAILSGSKDLVKLFLNKGAQVNAIKDWGKLTWMKNLVKAKYFSKYCDTTHLKNEIALDHHAKILSFLRLVLECFMHNDKIKTTPLHLAIYLQDNEIVNLLFEDKNLIIDLNLLVLAWVTKNNDVFVKLSKQARVLCERFLIQAAAIHKLSRPTSAYIPNVPEPFKKIKLIIDCLCQTKDYTALKQVLKDKKIYDEIQTYFDGKKLDEKSYSHPYQLQHQVVTYLHHCHERFYELLKNQSDHLQALKEKLAESSLQETETPTDIFRPF